jgi:hypothetical protein
MMGPSLLKRLQSVWFRLTANQDPKTDGKVVVYSLSGVPDKSQTVLMCDGAEHPGVFAPVGLMCDGFCARRDAVPQNGLASR